MGVRWKPGLVLMMGWSWGAAGGERQGVEEKLGFRAEGGRGVGGLRLGTRMGTRSGGRELRWGLEMGLEVQGG